MDEIWFLFTKLYDEISSVDAIWLFHSLGVFHQGASASEASTWTTQMYQKLQEKIEERLKSKLMIDSIFRIISPIFLAIHDASRPKLAREILFFDEIKEETETHRSRERELTREKERKLGKREIKDRE